MCAVVDGFKMFRVLDNIGISYPVAGVCEIDVKSRAVARGIKKPHSVQWHECYREFVIETDEIERSVLKLEIKEMIYADVAGFP